MTDDVAARVHAGAVQTRCPCGAVFTSAPGASALWALHVHTSTDCPLTITTEGGAAES